MKRIFFVALLTKPVITKRVFGVYSRNKFLALFTCLRNEFQTCDQIKYGTENSVLGHLIVTVEMRLSDGQELWFRFEPYFTCSYKNHAFDGKR